MSIYKEMYLTLFNEVTNAIDILECAQKKVEDIYIKKIESKPVLKKIEPALQKDEKE